MLIGIPSANSIMLDEKGLIQHNGSVFFHELIHIWQRRNPNIFEDLYNNYWHFTSNNKIIDNHNFKNKIRYNPDGFNHDYILNIKNDKLWLLCLYNDDATNIGEVTYKGIFLKKNGNNFVTTNKHDNLRSISSYNYLFNNIHGNHYHVNELSAELMTIFFLKQLNYNYNKFTNIGYKNMILWLKKSLN